MRHNLEQFLVEQVLQCCHLAIPQDYWLKVTHSMGLQHEILSDFGHWVAQKMFLKIF